MVQIPWIYLLVGLLLAPSLLWIIRDHRVWPWDQAWYGEVSVNLWFSLTHSLMDWARTMIGGLNSKPPGIVWLGQFFVPLQATLGSVEASLLFSILLTQSSILLVLFRIGRAMFPESYLIPAAGVTFAASTQLFVGLSHQYLVEPLQCAAVAWMLLIAAKVPVWPTARIAVHVTAALILGALAKTTTPVFCAAPAVYIALAVLRRGRASWEFRAEWKSRVSRALILLSAALGVLATVWYLRNRGDVLQHIRDASSGAIALRYGWRASPVVKFGTWTGLLEQSFGAPYLAWVLLLVCLVGALSWYSRKTKGLPAPFSGGAAMALISAVQVVILLFAFSLGDAVEGRYLYAILPCVVVIVMWLCAFAGSRKTVAVFGALCALQWILLHSVALGAVSYVADQSSWLLRVQGDTHDFEELMRVVRVTEVDGRYNIIGVEEPWFSANSAAFFAAKNRLSSGVAALYTSLGYAQTDVQAAMNRIQAISAKYVITLDESFQRAPPDFLNVVSLPVLRELQRGTQFKTIPFRSDKGILVFERLESASPWTILSTIFHSGAATGSDGAGQGWWTTHPSQRSAAVRLGLQQHNKPTSRLCAFATPPTVALPGS